MDLVVLDRATQRRYAARWGLVAAWKLDEASGARLDAYGSHDLTDNNTVGQAAGKVGNAAQFVAANNESLSIADNTSLSAGNLDFWAAGWAYLDNKSAERGLIGKYHTVGDQREWLLEWSSASDRFRFIVSSAGTDATAASINADALGAPSAGAWYFTLVWHDSVNDTINIRVNHGTTNSVGHATGVFDSTAPFRLGDINDGGVIPHDGRLDGWSFGKAPPGGLAGVIDEISAVLYNGGAGREWPF